MAGIITATNSYDERKNHTESRKNKPDSSHHRKWYATTIPELYRYLGILLFLGLHPESEYKTLWRSDHGNLGQYMALNRYKQLAWYFTLRDTVTNPMASSAEWWEILEPVATHLRTVCKKL